MFFDSYITPKFNKLAKTREQMLIDSLDAMVKDTRKEIDVIHKLKYNSPRI